MFFPLLIQSSHSFLQIFVLGLFQDIFSDDLPNMTDGDCASTLKCSFLSKSDLRDVLSMATTRTFYMLNYYDRLIIE